MHRRARSLGPQALPQALAQPTQAMGQPEASGGAQARTAVPHVSPGHELRDDARKIQTGTGAAVDKKNSRLLRVEE
jgi:hypothetical protein